MKYVCVMMMMMFFHCTSSERHRVVGPDVPLYAEYGSNFLLPCWIGPSTSALDMRVEWFRPDLINPVVHLYENHKDSNNNQIPSYRGRTHLFGEELQKGNASLLLNKVQVSDEGDYSCYIQASTWYDAITVKLNVEAVGTDPVITLEKYDTSGGFSLLCESKGWHPEPELQWMGNEGINLTDGAPETHREGELFNVKHRIYVPSGASKRFYCRVKIHRHMKESEIIISDQIFSTWKAAVIGGSVASVTIIAVGVGLMIWKVRRLREEDAEQVAQVLINVKGGRDYNRLDGVSLSQRQWAALSDALCKSEMEMEEFNLRKYSPSHEALVRLQQVIKSTQKAVLRECNLTAESCSVLSSVLSLNSSSLRELNLGYNNLQDSGVQRLSAGLKSPHCKLEILRLGKCNLTAESCSFLSSVLTLNSSSLRELNLNQNDLQDSGVQRLSAGLRSPHCKLEILELCRCNITDAGFADLASALTSNPSSNLKALHLYGNKPGESGRKLLSDLQSDPNYKLNKLQM